MMEARLVARLASSIRTNPLYSVGIMDLELGGPAADLDLPTVCNHLAAKYKCQAITVVRRPSTSAKTGELCSAILRFSGIMDKTRMAALDRDLNKDHLDLAKAIVKWGQ